MGYLPYDITIKTIAWVILLVYLVLLGILFIFKHKKASKEVKFVNYSINHFKANI